MSIEIILFGLFLFLGILMSMGKGSFLIAGFNTMTKDEKDKYDKVALCKFMGKMMFVFSLCIALGFLSTMFEISILRNIEIILFISSIVFMLVYLNTGNRFKK